MTTVRMPITTAAPIGSASNTSNPPGSGFALSAPLVDSSNKKVGEINLTCIATQAR